MIVFTKKPEPAPESAKPDENRFEDIRKAAAERHRKSDTDGARRRSQQKADDNRLV